ncbi:MAG: hypothetical protein ACREU9_11870 [Gammaproteobacteria bacterium]
MVLQILAHAWEIPENVDTQPPKRALWPDARKHQQREFATNTVRQPQSYDDVPAGYQDLGMDSPQGRDIGKVIEIAALGRLHHHYLRQGP